MVTDRSALRPFRPFRPDLKSYRSQKSRFTPTVSLVSCSVATRVQQHYVRNPTMSIDSMAL